MNYSNIPAIFDYQLSCESVAIQFLSKYFPTEQYSPDDWVGGEIGGGLVVGDMYFFTLSEMVQYLQYEYTRDQLLARYELALEQASQNNGIPIPNIKNWLKLQDYDEDTVRGFKE